MNSSQTTASVDSEDGGLRSRSRSQHALHSSERRRGHRLHPSLLVPALDVTMQRPIVDRVSRYRCEPFIIHP